MYYILFLEDGMEEDAAIAGESTTYESTKEYSSHGKFITNFVEILIGYFVT